MGLMYVANLVYTTWTILHVCNKAKSCVRVIRPNFCPIQFDPIDEGSMFLPQNWKPPARLHRATNRRPTI